MLSEVTTKSCIRITIRIITKSWCVRHIPDSHVPVNLRNDPIKIEHVNALTDRQAQQTNIQLWNHSKSENLRKPKPKRRNQNEETKTKKANRAPFRSTISVFSEIRAIEIRASDNRGFYPIIAHIVWYIIPKGPNRAPFRSTTNRFRDTSDWKNWIIVKKRLVFFAP